MPFEHFENTTNQGMPSVEKPKGTIKREKPIDSPEGAKVPGREESSKVDDTLKIDKIREELRKIQGEEREAESKHTAAEQKREFREEKEKLKMNDIIIGESDLGAADNLLKEADIKFQAKRFLEKERLPNSEATLPGEFILRLDKSDDESADKAFTILRQARLDCHIVKDIIDLDKTHNAKETNNH